MHDIQEKILKLIDRKNIGPLSLREIGAEIGEKFPQKIKHHLVQLEKKGLIIIDRKRAKIVRSSDSRDGVFVSLPIVGAANCGEANIFADENVEGYLKLSKKLVPRGGRLFVLRAEGDSMNQARIKDKKPIESGDFVIVDANQKEPEQDKYVVSVIDGLANIKKLVIDRKNKRIILKSESSKSYLPIFVHQDDSYQICGRVVDVIKK